jgi:hypothetical protein
MAMTLPTVMTPVEGSLPSMEQVEKRTTRFLPCGFHPTGFDLEKLTNLSKLTIRDHLAGKKMFSPPSLASARLASSSRVELNFEYPELSYLPGVYCTF